MAAQLDPLWGPFLGREDAQTRLCHFVDRSCAPTVGVVWASHGMLYPLRPPRKAAEGLADVVVFHWSPMVKPPPPPAPSGFVARFKAFIRQALEAQAQAQMAQAQADMAMGKALGNVWDRMIHTHRDDGVGVALDVLCIALSIALIPTGIGLVTTAAGIAALGGVALLAMDGTSYAMELGGDDEGAEKVKKATEIYRIIATVMTLPDLFKGGYVAVKELREAVQALPRAEQTAVSAERMAARTHSSPRGEHYGQIAERAHLRAQIRREQIIASLKHEITPRGSGAGSAGLLIREEIQNQESLLHQALTFLQVHATSISR